MRIKEVGEQNICTSIVAAEVRYGATEKCSSRLTMQLEAVLNVVNVFTLEQPVDVILWRSKNSLARAGRSIRANDLLIAAHALTSGHTVVTNNVRAYSRIDDLDIENWLRWCWPPKPRRCAQ
jgi:tRNA(fMet)-specific endonuclease VapC